MIVTEDNVSAALKYLAADPHPLANAQKAVMFAEKAKAEHFAQLYLASTGTAKERESQVLIDPVYSAALTEEIEAQAEAARHKRRVAAAEMLLEIYRTEAANARAAERVY